MKEPASDPWLVQVEESISSIGGYFGGLIGAPLLYVITRLLRPEIVVETGVASGRSTAYILAALKRNSHGRLFSIDMPNLDPKARLPSEKEVGWLVPDELKDRWSLTLGRTKDVLPTLLDKLQEIDMFLHDDEHTYENMMFEFRTVWRFLRPGGLLLSDDVVIKAFDNFCKEVDRVGILTHAGSMGAVKK